MRKLTLSLVTIFFVLFLWGCYPEGPSYTQDLDVVITSHKSDYDFVAKSTYAMPDRIVKITGNIAEGKPPTFIPDATAAQVLQRIASNLEALGWQRVAVSASPDMLLEPAEMEVTTMYYYYDYWYWWYGGYYPYYPYSPPVSYGGSYTTGTLLMFLVDPNVVGGNGNPVNQWTGVINGILESKYDPSRVNPLIDKAFEQSPYLKTK